MSVFIVYHITRERHIVGKCHPNRKAAQIWPESGVCGRFQPRRPTEVYREKISPEMESGSDVA